MTERHRIAVTLHWHGEDGDQERWASFFDQTPQELIPKLVGDLKLPIVDRASDKIVYELRLGGEHRPALRPRELLSGQNVRFGSDLWLAPQATSHDLRTPRCILQLPEGTEVIIGARGQPLTRRWLLEFLRLHNPDEHRREQERARQGLSAYLRVSDSGPHCTVCVCDRGYWIVTTDRADVVTEWATGQEFDQLPIGAPIRLDNGMRLRLGGRAGLEVAVILL
jgi:hypothetical protein